MNSRSSQIVQHLPSLRRYAAAICGSSQRADACVEMALERLLQDSSEIEPERVRAAMFRQFEQVQASLAEAAAAAASASSLREAVNRLDPSIRKVLLMRVVEKLPSAEVAEILGIAPEEVEQRLLRARESLRTALSARVLVIEDEPILAMAMAHTLARMGHQVCAVASNRIEALRKAKETRPHLILADVRLRGGDDGIRTVEEILADGPVPVIFVTGHAPKVIQQAQMRPALVIGKPFIPQTLEIAVTRVLGHRGARRTQAPAAA